MTTGEGGMIVTNDDQVAMQCRSMRNQGRDPSPEWLQHVRLGYNYRLSDIHAALGSAQLERIEELLQSRQRVADAYHASLARLQDLKLPRHPEYAKPSWFVYVVQIKGTRRMRDNIIASLRGKGIGCQAYFPAIHQQPYMREFLPASGMTLPNTEMASATSLALPFHSRMTDAEVAYVSQQLEAAIEQAISDQVTAVA
jgi:perosamine synthetase